MKPLINPIDQPKPNRTDNFRKRLVVTILRRDEALLFRLERALLFSFSLKRNLKMVETVRMTLATITVAMGTVKANRFDQNLTIKHLPLFP